MRPVDASCPKQLRRIDLLIFYLANWAVDVPIASKPGLAPNG
jgi:hypothetical protein